VLTGCPHRVTPYAGIDLGIWN